MRIYHFILAVFLYSFLIVFNASAKDQSSSAWYDFNKQTDTKCPSLRIKDRPVGDLSYLQDNFSDTLKAEEKRAFENAIPRVDGGPKPCADLNGLSCPTEWNMIALKKVGLLSRFVDYACSNVKNIP